VTNNGPCPAPAVVLVTTTTLLEYVDGTGDCPTEDDCKLGTMDVSATKSFSRRYKVLPPPGSSAADGAYAHTAEVDVSSNDVTDSAGTVTTPATWDPDGDNSTARPVVVANHAASGCGSAGRGVDIAVLAGLPALLLFARAQRRRGAAKKA
jgi:hypothetical protein